MEPPPPSMLHLAMAAFFGASLMAISALFIHKRTVDQVLERLIQVRRRNIVFRDDQLVDGEVEQDKQDFGDEGFDGDDNEGFEAHDDYDDDDDDDDDDVQKREIRGQVWAAVQGATGVGELFNVNCTSSSVPNAGAGYFSSNWLDDDTNYRCLSSSLDKSHLPLLQRFLRNGNTF